MAAPARDASRRSCRGADLPSTAGTPGGRGGPVPGPAAGRFRGGRRRRAARADHRAAVLSFLVDDYLTCPRKYQYAHVLRVRVATTRSCRSALHRAALPPAACARARHERGGARRGPRRGLVERGFVSRDHEEARHEAGRRRSAASGPPSWSPVRSSRPTSSASSARRAATGSVGRWDRRRRADRGRAGRTRRPGRNGRRPRRRGSPTLGMTGRERDDHGLQVSPTFATATSGSGRATRSSSRSTRWATRP
jgi:hypothetical protein